MADITPPASVPAAPVPVVKSYKGMAIISWILMIVTCLIAIIPVIGFATWIFALIVVPLVVIFAIVILTRGGTGHGIVLLIAAIVLMPGWLLLAPVVSTLVLGASVTAKEQAEEKQIVANLETIASAKSQFASESGASSGSAVTMADLTKYLGDTGIKPVVGETYEPHAIGEAPGAKLPPNKGLASHKPGDEITASGATTTTAPSPSPSASAEEEE